MGDAPRACVFLDGPVKIVVLSPHRDDAAFSVGLSIASWLAAQHTVQVLNCFTRSEYAPFSDVGSLHANDRQSFVTATRKREDIAWLKLLKVRMQSTDLDMLDAPLRLACMVDEVLTVPMRAGDRAVARVAGAVAKLARAGSADHAAFILPLAVGGHIDHRVVLQAGLEALAGLSVPIAFYEDLPYAARPEGSDQIARQVAAVALDLQPAFAGEIPQHADEALVSKRRMAECYDSQIDSVVAGQIAGFCLTFGGRERLWVNAAWLRSAWLSPATAAHPA